MMEFEKIKNELFNKSLSDVYEILGDPKDIQYFDNKSTAQLYYKSKSLMLFFKKKRNTYFVTRVHLDNLCIGGAILQTGKTKLWKAIKLIINYYLEKNTKLDITFEDCDLDIMIEFKNIGLTIWIERNKISDISISHRCV